ncbi:Fic family protein [Methylocystis sp. Sn-Cys]|uniref:Fic family protein n=1 Tax=Methylocystis sp. Sn-Cys TaxID=1701263 RepID=UPI001922EE56|nr:Fic family protein [Methylocystis sp. Sn-Cys]MBL1257626.1 Fic family protein [Methylocystis sp. Sn-Cys]
MIPLSGTPYALSGDIEHEFLARIKEIEERVFLLRNSGTLTETTLLSYYGKKRFEQVAESNAIEGSTLDVGETELAILKGITVTGHDPAYVRDAISLDKALTRLVEIARDRSKVTSIPDLLELHGLILGDRPSGGQFRKDRVRITGATHVPPKTLEAIISAMEEWERWSCTQCEAPAPIRAAVLHAWLTHIHPFVDGNGRTARAVSNLELVRAGYPPIIIRKKERDRYVAALAESDEAGDISSFLALILERVVGALTGLEISAKQNQQYSPLAERIRINQEKQLEVWNKSVSLLSAMIELNLSKHMEQIGGKVYKKDFGGIADIEDFISLCHRTSISRSWSFIISMGIPGAQELAYLGFIGHRSAALYQNLHEGGPSLHWAVARPETVPKWQRALSEAPYAKEITTRLGKGDEWVAVLPDDSIREHTTSELAENIANSLMEAIEKRLTS